VENRTPFLPRLSESRRMRIFVGVPLSAAVIHELAAISQRLRPAAAGIRWTEPESWHITLQFLGNALPEQYQSVVAQLSGIHLSPVPVRVDRMGLFDRAGILHAGVKVSPELLQLQKRVVQATAICGFVPETRPYQPHITLARVKDRRSLSDLKSKMPHHPNFTGFAAEEFLLYESFLGAEGSRYEVRNRFPLDGC
jgi:2'-5' RNA ligase